MTILDRRAFGRLAGAWAASSLLPANAARAQAADPLALVDPELRPVARRILQSGPSLPTLSAATVAQSRLAMKQFQRPVLDTVPVSERRVPGSNGQPDVLVYIVNSRPGVARPAILHTHGGGFVVGSAKFDIGNLQEISAKLDCVVVTVEYRLAPETRFAGSIEDNYAALKWLYAHAAELGVDQQRIAVMGESAGGGHAALLAITARDRGEVPLLFQCLVQPMLDDRTGSSRRVPPHIGKLIWTEEANRFGWGAFLGQAPGGSVPAGAVPARTPSLAGLPPAWIGVGALDLFVDEDIDYAQRLIGDGVPAELSVVPGAFHGFDMIAADTVLATRFTDNKINSLRRAFARPPS